MGDKPFGNIEVTSLEQSLELFADYAEQRSKWDRKWLDPLRGKNLACWCSLSSKCHVDTLLRLANA